MHISHRWLWLLSVEGGGSVVVESLFNILLVVCGGLCLVLVVLCTTKCPFKFCKHLENVERESWLLYINCLPDAL